MSKPGATAERLAGRRGQVGVGCPRMECTERAVEHLTPRRVMLALARVRLAPDDPRVAVVGLVAAVVDPVVDPDEVALDELAGLGRRGEHEVVGDRHRPVGGLAAHHLPDGVDGVRRCPELEQAPQQPATQVGRLQSGLQHRLDVGDGGFVDGLRATDALDLVGGLHDLGRADDSAGVHELPIAQGGAERHREVVDREATRR